MKVKRLRNLLYEMQNEGYGNYILNFSDQDCDSYTIDYVYCDDDDDCCLQSNNFDDNDYSVDELLEELEPFDDDDYVYVEHYNDYDNDTIIWEQIDGVWYYDDDEEELTIDMHYEYD